MERRLSTLGDGSADRTTGGSRVEAGSDTNDVASASQFGPSTRPVRVAWLGTATDNTYDGAMIDGAVERARRMGGQVEALYCGFDPEVQREQFDEVVRSGAFDAIVVVAVDGPAVARCMADAAARGIPVVAADLPVDGDPAVAPAGQTCAVVFPVARFAKELARLVVAVSAPMESCNAVYLAGSLDGPVDGAAMRALDAACASGGRARIIAREEAAYDEGAARDRLRRVLEQTPDVHLVVAAGDQMARGAERAIAERVSADHAITIIGAGASAYGVDAVRDGRWFATFVTVPYDMGRAAAETAVRAARGERVTPSVIDPLERIGLPAFITADNVGRFTDFVAQWPG